MIGEFLKELDLTEGRSTEILKILKVMKENGSPPPEFETDEDRTSFLIRLPVHERAVQGLAGEVTSTIPDKPRSSKQRYRLTDKGRKCWYSRRRSNERRRPQRALPLR